ncbi:MAG: hypothetical protein ACLTG0_07970 [Oscillibacter sp.]
MVINGESLGLGGYLDIGIIDTMKDLFVNFIGAVVFSLSGFFFARSKGRRKSAAQGFVPQQKDRGAGLSPAGAGRGGIESDADAPTRMAPRRRGRTGGCPERPTQTENHRLRPVVFAAAGICRPLLFDVTGFSRPAPALP